MSEDKSPSPAAQIQALLARLSPRQKQLLAAGVAVVAVVLIFTLMYQHRKAQVDHRRQATEDPFAFARGESSRDLSLEPGALQESVANQFREALKARDKKIEQLSTHTEALRAQLEQLEHEAGTRLERLSDKTEQALHRRADDTSDDTKRSASEVPVPFKLTEAEAAKQDPGTAYGGRVILPPPPAPRTPLPVEQRAPTDSPEAFAGGILHVEASELPAPAPTRAAVKKKNTVTLPVSFMKATLLTGLDTPASQRGESEPDPVMLRIDAPAVLPNRVKANLSGCFILAAATGNLAQERVEVRLTNLTCLAENGSALIDQPVKGWLFDADGKFGLRAHVYSKMGAVLARQALAGVFSGIGETVQLDNATQSTSALGSTTTIETDRAVQAGIGGGIKQASKSLSDFYLELARQTVPGLEVLPDHTVTVVIGESVELEIKEPCLGGGCVSES